MDWTLAQTYYLVASIAGIVATVINVILYWRNRPNRLQAAVAGAVDKAVAPIVRSVEDVRRDMATLEARQERCEVGSKALDHELSGRLQELDAKMDGQTDQLTRIGATVQHIQQHDQDATLHHRVTDVAKTVHELKASVQAQGTQLHMIHTFLLSQGKG